jgi:hypothetical protein
MSGEVIPQELALRLLGAAIAGDEPASSYFELRPLDPTGRQEFIPVRDLHGLQARVEVLRERHQLYIGAAPRSREAGTADAVSRVWCLWADVDTREAVEQLRKFRPLSSIVVRSGGGLQHLHAWWALRESISPEWAERSNGRLVHRLGSDSKVIDRAHVMRPVISVNRKVDPPTSVECIHLSLDVYTVSEVVGRLADPPLRVGMAARKAAPSSRANGDAPAALGGLARVVREARAPMGDQPGERNEKLNWAAFQGGRHVAAGHMMASEVEKVLLSAAVDTGLSEAEALRTIRSGMDAGSKK